jgi:hypothetical protein
MAREFDEQIPATRRIRDVRPTAIQVIAMKTPVFSAARKGLKPMHSTPEYPVKTFNAPVITGTVERDITEADITNNVANTDHLKSRFHMNRKVVGATKTANVLGKLYADTATIVASSAKDAFLEMNVEFEAVTLADQEAVPGVTNTVASVTRGLPRLCSNADARFTDTATTPPTAYRTPAGNIMAGVANANTVKEDDVEGLLASAATVRNGDPEGNWIGLCSPAMRRQFGTFTRLDTNATTTAMPLRRFNGTEGVINRKVRKYLSDFGDLDLITAYRMDAVVHFMAYDQNLVDIGVAQAPVKRDLEDRGAGPVSLIDAIWVCMGLNPKDFVKITSVGTA